MQDRESAASGEGTQTPIGGWRDPEQVAWYTARIGKLEARLAGEAVLREILPAAPQRVLDLGCGDGRLAALVLESRPSVTRVVAADRSEPMLRLAEDRFTDDRRVTVVRYDLGAPLPFDESFDLITSGFAIHHVSDERKRTLFGELRRSLELGGLFANLEVIRSATDRRHQEFLAAIGRDADDPEDQLATIEDQLDWMRAAGFDNVDCLWRWRGFALLAGEV